MKFDSVVESGLQVGVRGRGGGGLRERVSFLGAAGRFWGWLGRRGRSLGDVGVLLGNGFETLQRTYWSNKASGLVSDLPSDGGTDAIGGRGS